MAARDDNRKRFPHCTAVVDDFRAAFGEVVVLKVVEGDQQAVSKRHGDDAGMRVMSSTEFLAVGKLDREMAALRDRKSKRGRK